MPWLERRVASEGTSLSSRGSSDEWCAEIKNGNSLPKPRRWRKRSLEMTRKRSSKVWSRFSSTRLGISGFELADVDVGKQEAPQVNGIGLRNQVDQRLAGHGARDALRCSRIKQASLGQHANK